MQNLLIPTNLIFLMQIEHPYFLDIVLNHNHIS